MLRSWKVFGLTLVFGFSVVLLLPREGSVTSPSTVLANHDEQITVDVVGTGNANVGFTITGDCQPASLSIDDNDAPQVLDCDADDGVAKITASTIPAGFTLIDIDCDIDAGGPGPTPGPGSTFIESVANKWVDIDMTDNEHWTCVFTFSSSNTPTATGTPPTATPTATGTVTVSAVTVSIAPSTLACNGSAFVTVVARNAGGQVIAAGAVTLQTNIGTISPTSATDQGAGVLAVLTAPSNQGGTATVQVNAGGVAGSAQATINCAQATSVPPTSVPPTVAPVTGILPPSTGDAGLAGNADGRVYAGLALLAFVLAGGVSLARSRARS